jgi:hypothetical protein
MRFCPNAMISSNVKELGQSLYILHGTLFETLVFQKYLETVLHRKSNCFRKHLLVFLYFMHFKVPRLKCIQWCKFLYENESYVPPKYLNFL